MALSKNIKLEREQYSYHKMIFSCWTLLPLRLEGLAILYGHRQPRSQTPGTLNQIPHHEHAHHKNTAVNIILETSSLCRGR